MSKKTRGDGGEPEAPRVESPESSEEQTKSRREFLVGLGKWSAVIVGAVVGMMPGEGEAKKKNLKYWDQPGWSDSGWSNNPWSNTPWSNTPWYHSPWSHNPGYQDYSGGRCRCPGRWSNLPWQ